MQKTRGAGWACPARHGSEGRAKKHAGQAPHLRVCQCGCRACAAWLGLYRNTDGRTRDQRGCPPHTVGAGLARHGALQKTRGPGWSRPARRRAGRRAKSMRGKPRIYGYVNAGAGLVRCGSAGIGIRMDDAWSARMPATHRRCRACPARRPRPARRPAKNTRAGMVSPRHGAMRDGVQKSMRGKPRIYGYVNAGAGLVRRGSAGIGTRMDERVISADARHTVGAGLARHAPSPGTAPCKKHAGRDGLAPARRHAGRRAEKHAGQAPHLQDGMPCRRRACAAWLGRYRNTDGRTRDQRGCLQHTVGAGLARHGAMQKTRGAGWACPARHGSEGRAKKHAGQAPHLRVCQCGCRACAAWLGRYRDTDGRTRDQPGCPPHRRCRACPARRHRPARRDAGRRAKTCGASPASTGRGGPASRPGRRPGSSRSARWWSVPARSRTRWPRWAPRCRRRAR